ARARHAKVDDQRQSAEASPMSTRRRGTRSPAETRELLSQLLRSLPERDGLPPPIECEPLGGLSLIWPGDNGRAVEVECRRNRTIVRMLSGRHARPVNLV